MEPAISIENLSKKYVLQNTAPYVALRDVVAASVKKIFQPKTTASFFWALKELNLSIDPGERIGIIGHNGAGKSTLLKIISRITPPSTGRVVINGRVASLLEVGTGFHPELSGRENIYLNGSILGLTKKEITKKLDEIIAFSGVEEFIDAPLKNYSSGMQLRLAFSVAAHLEPEILLIDEVLSVGDFEFQKKCMGKMEEISRSDGRTIVFVSHNMAAIKKLCTKGIVLKNGEAVFQGDVHEAVQVYTRNFQSVQQSGEGGRFNLVNHPNKVNESEGLMNASLFVDGQASKEFFPGATLSIQLDYFLKTKLTDPEIGIVIKDENYQPLIGLNNKNLGSKLELQTQVPGKASIQIPGLNVFAPGRYLVDLYLGDQYHFYECLYDAVHFTVTEADVYESGIMMKPEWNAIFVPNIQISAE